MGSLAGRRALAFQGGVEARGQGFAVERLGQESRLRPPSARARESLSTAKSGEENERQAVSAGRAGGPAVRAPLIGRHSDIGDHARRAAEVGRSARTPRPDASLGMDGVAERPHEVAGRGANGPIIVDDRDHRWVRTQRSFLMARTASPMHRSRLTEQCVANQDRKIILRLCMRERLPLRGKKSASRQSGVGAGPLT